MAADRGKDEVYAWSWCQMVSGECWAQSQLLIGSQGGEKGMRGLGRWCGWSEGRVVQR